MHVLTAIVVLEVFALVFLVANVQEQSMVDVSKYIEENADGKKYIKYVEFNATYEALCKAYQMDVDTYGKDIHLNWVELLAYTAAKTGGEFGKKSISILEQVSKELQAGATLESLTKKMKYYSYYEQAYDTVLGGLVGTYKQQKEDGTSEEAYGLMAYSPIAKGFDYNSYDDFGASRSYGFSRPHQGHDMMGLIGTPIIAVESGYVEAVGWNQYGGWRIGIRSLDGKRYYYYAHLRQNRPYAEGLEEGKVVTAGDVIGYMGHTGYSTTENTNNIKVVHLHFGLELVFDESQKESDNEIWVDCYALTEFLKKNRSEVVRDETTKEWKRVNQMEDPRVQEYLNEHPDSAAIEKT